jgi:FMN phosphatase YigB (HAD superfamily)
MPIKNIIFDFGNVLFDLDLERTTQVLQELLGKQYEQARQQLLQHRVFELYETGGLSTGEFVDALRFSVQPPLSETQVINAWNAIFIKMPRSRFDMLLRLRARYKVFLLSNINDLHASWIDSYMEREHQIQDFQQRYFDGVYYSHLIRLRKPNRDIYEYILADAELLPEECVFFDDLDANIQMANTLGIQGVLHPVGTDIEARVAAMGFLA